MLFGTQLGTDWSQIWQQAKTVGTDIVKSLPGAVEAAATKTVTEKLQPIAQQAVEAKTQRVIKKGNLAMFLLGGAALGAIVAGGSWQRRAVGGTAVAIAAGLASWQIGWLSDK